MIIFWNGQWLTLLSEIKIRGEHSMKADVAGEVDYEWMFVFDVVVKEWPSKRKQLRV